MRVIAGLTDSSETLVQISVVVICRCPSALCTRYRSPVCYVKSQGGVFFSLGRIECFSSSDSLLFVVVSDQRRAQGIIRQSL